MSQAVSQPKQPKPKGTCSHCLETGKLHSGGLLHLHGPRATRCVGSNRPSLEHGGGTIIQTRDIGGEDDLTPRGDSHVAPSGVSNVANGEQLAHPPYRGPMLKHICRGARPACARALASVLRDICVNPSSIESWSALLNFAPAILGQPPRAGKRRNMTTVIKARVEGWTKGSEMADAKLDSSTGARRQRSQEEKMLAAIGSKLEDGNIRAAIRILCDGGNLAIPDGDNLALLKEKHPANADPDALTRLPDPSVIGAWQVSVDEVLEAVRTFPNGSAGGPDGFRPVHLLELVGSGEEARPLAEALTDFTNLLLRGECPPSVRPTLFGGNLIALNKETGGLRPIAIGYVWRRLAAKCANKHAVSKLSSFFAPVQLGIAVPGGCEAAVHATRRFIGSMGPDQVLVKLDFTNAFNSLRRDVMLKAVRETIPELYPFALQAYSAPSILRFGHLLLQSETGPQQGNPLGPLLFSLPLQPMLQALESELKIGFIDDITLGGEAWRVAHDIEVVAELETTMGLVLNQSKCEIYSPDSSRSQTAPFLNYTQVKAAELELLGAPLFRGEALNAALEEQCTVHRRSMIRLQKLPSQSALIRMRSSFGVPHLGYLLRCSPCTGHHLLETFDELQRAGLEAITNCSLNETQWLQASLPVRDGGLGVRRAASLASSAYLASAAATLDLQTALLTGPSGEAPSPDKYWEQIMELRENSMPDPANPYPSKQSAWDRPLIERDKAEICLLQGDDLVGSARLDAVASPHSADWLSAMPIAACGLVLDNKAGVAIVLRLI